MTDLLTRPLLRRDEPAWGSQVPWLAAIIAAGWALAASLALTVLPGVTVWIAQGAITPMGDPLHFGARLWLVTQRIGLDVNAADVTFAPLGLTIGFVLLLHRSARWATHCAGVSTTRGVISVVLPAIVTYVVGAGVVAGVSATPDVASMPLEALVWAGLWSTTAMVGGAAHESGLLRIWFGRIPPLVRTCLAAGMMAAAGLVAVGSTLTMISAIVNSSRVGELVAALDAGAVGTIVLVVGSALIVPNVVVWATAFALGPGFVVGAGTSVAPGGVELGLMPAVPALGALPADLPGRWSWLVLLGPLVVGALIGVLLHRRMPPAEPGETSSLPLRWTMGVVAGTSVVAGAAMAALAMVSGGSAGAARLAVIGPDPLLVAAMTMALLAAPAVVAVLILRWRATQGTQDAVDDEDDYDHSDDDDVPAPGVVPNQPEHA